MAVSELFTAISEYVVPLTAQWRGAWELLTAVSESPPYPPPIVGGELGSC